MKPDALGPVQWDWATGDSWTCMQNVRQTTADDRIFTVLMHSNTKDSYVEMWFVDLTWAVNTIFPQLLISKLDQQKFNTLLMGRLQAAEVRTTHLAATPRQAPRPQTEGKCTLGMLLWVITLLLWRTCCWGPLLDQPHIYSDQKQLTRICSHAEGS